MSSSTEIGKKCPDCAELVKIEASVCRFCGYRWARPAELPAPTATRFDAPPTSPGGRPQPTTSIEVTALTLAILGATGVMLVPATPEHLRPTLSLAFAAAAGSAIVLGLIALWSARRSGKQTKAKGFTIAALVLGAFGAVVGTIASYPSPDSARTAVDKVVSQMVKMRQRGASIDGVACVNEALDWHDNDCTAPGRMCVDAVPRIVGECLAAQDRTALCADIGTDEKPSQWAYSRCKARGVDRTSKKEIKESCTQAWRALDSWCKSGQNGVSL